VDSLKYTSLTSVKYGQGEFFSIGEKLSEFVDKPLVNKKPVWLEYGDGCPKSLFT